MVFGGVREVGERDEKEMDETESAGVRTHTEGLGSVERNSLKAI